MDIIFLMCSILIPCVITVFSRSLIFGLIIFQLFVNGDYLGFLTPVANLMSTDPLENTLPEIIPHIHILEQHIHARIINHAFE